MREFVKEIITDLEVNYNKWNTSETRHTFDNGKGLQIWISNITVLDIEIYKPERIKLKFFEKLALHKAIKKAKINKTGGII